METGCAAESGAKGLFFEKPAFRVRFPTRFAIPV